MTGDALRTGTDLRVHSPDRLMAVAAELNDRPRKTLGWDTPAARLGVCLLVDTGHGRWRQVIEAIVEGNTTRAAAILEQVVPESPDNTGATVVGCIGTVLDLLDDWLNSSGSRALKDLGQGVQLPAGLASAWCRSA